MARSGHVKKMARDGESEPRVPHVPSPNMHDRYDKGISIRILRNGDTATIAAVFERLSDESRRLRFGGPKPRLSDAELAALALVDADHHVLVAYVDGDPGPVGVARLARVGRREGEVAFAVVDEHQGRGIGTALARNLAADARAAGFVELHATVTGNPRTVTPLLARPARRLRSRWQAGECRLIAALD
jgi:GNAT superfamily N-acetyltransferase